MTAGLVNPCNSPHPYDDYGTSSSFMCISNFTSQLQLSVSPSELFPSIVWSAVAGTSVSTLSCPQSISVDVRRADCDCDSEPEVYWNLILDQTTLNIGFDIECLDGLDNTLLLSPNDAFAALCWDTIPQTPLPRPLIPKSLAASAHKSPLSIISEASIASKSSVKIPRHRPAPLTITSGTSSGEEGYESDSDDLRTLGDEATSLSSPLPSPFPSPLPSPYGTGFHLNHQPTVEPITLVCTSNCHSGGVIHVSGPG